MGQEDIPDRKQWPPFPVADSTVLISGGSSGIGAPSTQEQAAQQASKRLLQRAGQQRALLDHTRLILGSQVQALRSRSSSRQQAQKCS